MSGEDETEPTLSPEGVDNLEAIVDIFVRAVERKHRGLLAEAAEAFAAKIREETPAVAPDCTAPDRPHDGLLTLNDVAVACGVKRSKAYEIWANLPKVRLGPRCLRVRRDALDEFLRTRERRSRW